MTIEQFVIDYLEDSLGIPVSGQIPDHPNPSTDPQEFIVVQLTGSTMTDHIWESTLAIQSYSDTLAKASKLNTRAVRSMLDIITENQICRSYLNSAYEYTDESTKSPRYQAVFVLSHYYMEGEE